MRGTTASPAAGHGPRLGGRPRANGAGVDGSATLYIVGPVVRFLVTYETPDDPAAFDRHYRDVHIPLAKQLPGLRRYTVSRNSAPVRGGDAYYLVAELDWADMPALKAAFASPECRATARDVAELATDGVRGMIFEVEEV